ncbi:hypothetical protein SLE2022_271910 [Rubroshorea leprosula]
MTKSWKPGHADRLGPVLPGPIALGVHVSMAHVIFHEKVGTLRENVRVRFQNGTSNGVNPVGGTAVPVWCLTPRAMHTIPRVNAWCPGVWTSDPSQGVGLIFFTKRPRSSPIT